MSAVVPSPSPVPDPDPADAEPGAAASPRPRRALTLAGPPASPERSTGAREPDPSPERRPSDALRVRLVPRAEPPAVPLRREGPAHERPPVLGSPEALGRPRPPALRPGPDGEDGPAADGPLPDPTRLCCAVVQAAVEGLRGVRPLAQLVRWVTPEVYDGLALRARLVQEAAVTPSAARAGIRRVRVCRIGDGAAEATVVVDDGPRVRAVALRLEEHRGRWRAVVLEIG